MTWELLITLGVLAVVGVGLGIFAIVKSVKSANAKDAEEQVAETAELVEEPVEEVEAQPEVVEPVAEEITAEAAETAEPPVKDAVPAEDVERVIIVGEEPQPEETEQPVEETAEGEAVEEEPTVSVIKLAAIEGSYLKDPAAPFGKTNLDEEIIAKGEINGEPIVIIGGDDALVMKGDVVENEELVAGAIEKLDEEKSVFDGLNGGVRIPFKDKMLGAEQNVQNYYDIINNEFLSYRKVHGRISVAGVSYRFGRELKGKITYRGKTMKLHLALSVADYDENVYHQKDFGDVKAYAEVPFTVKVKSDRGLKNAITLIAELFAKLGVVKKARYEKIDSIAQLMGIEDKKPAPVKTAPAPVPKKEVVKKAPKAVETVVTAADDVEEETAATGNFGTRIPFKDKMLGAEENVQGYYDEINNEFLSFRKVHGRVSVAGVSYRFGRELIAKITYRGKTMKLNLALNPDEYDENVYHQKNVGDVKAYAEVPFAVKVKSDRGLRNALALIGAVCEEKGVERKARYEMIDSISELKN